MLYAGNCAVLWLSLRVICVRLNTFIQTCRRNVFIHERSNDYRPNCTVLSRVGTKLFDRGWGEIQRKQHIALKPR